MIALFHKTIHRAIVLLSLTTVPIFAEDHLRMVLLQVPPAESTAIRSKLSGAAPEAIEEVLGKPGVEVVADFKEENPWRPGTISLTKSAGMVNFDGEKPLELEIRVEIEGKRKENGNISARLSSDIMLPDGKKGFWQFHQPGILPDIHPGAWLECSLWGDSQKTTMLWLLATSDEGGEEAAPTDDAKSDGGRVEMIWFRVEEGDLEMLAKSKPETRDKAFKWLSGRGETWNECVFRYSIGNRVAWLASYGQAPASKDAAMREDRLSIDGEPTRAGDGIAFKWDIYTAELKSEEEIHVEISSQVTPSIWEFTPVEGVAQANVVAWRCVAD